MRWPAKVVLVCFAAGVVEFWLGYQTTAYITWGWMVTSAVCIVASVIGLFQKPRTVWTALCGLGVVVGIIGFAIGFYIEMIVAAFTPGI